MAVSSGLDDAGISAREAEVLAALGEHLTNAEIAERLYISVRTVESHVSSLLRKLGADDRRSLARVAAARVVAPGPAGDPGRVPAPPAGAAGPGDSAPPLPSPLTPFVGRAAERAALAQAVTEARLVTALGPGGVGKTRLALAVAGEVAGRFSGRVWYVDLVPVTGAGMVAAAIAAALGVGEVPGQTLEETVAANIGPAPSLLVLDNCEHLVDGVAALVERLLTRCPGLTVLATSRIRLVLPFERPFPVPGLSVDEVEPAGDAVALFLARAAAVGVTLDDPDHRARVATVCRALEGMALAIELAASRLPAIGLDGLEAGLGDRLRVLTGGSRADERHRSLRATLDWSYNLATSEDRAVLRRVAVFAGPFTAAAAVEVVADPADPDPAHPAGPGDADPADPNPAHPAGSDPAGSDPAGSDPADPGSPDPDPARGVVDVPLPEAVPDALARLVDQSLLVAVPSPGETRYRALEVVRQYAMEATAAPEADATRGRHLAWCVATARALDPGDIDVEDTWRAAIDRVADDLRAALAWAGAAGAAGARRAQAAELATLLAGLAYRRGRASESQYRYEEAAALTADGAAAAELLHRAAEVASNRQAGDDAFRLHQESAEAALRGGDTVAAARYLAFAATVPNRCPGIMAQLPPPGTDRALLDRAQALGVGHPEVEAALLVADAFTCEDGEPLTEVLAARAVTLARRDGDALLESAALDVLTANQLAMGELLAAAESARLRTVLLRPLPMTPEASFERVDAYQMAAQTALGAGDIAGARRFSLDLVRSTTIRDTPHLGLARLLLVDALAGDWDAIDANGATWLASWEASGRRAVSNVAGAPRAMALVSGLRGDEEDFARWLALGKALRSVIDQLPGAPDVVGPYVEAMVQLHRGRHAEAVATLADPPDLFRYWFNGVWRHLYAAAWAEAAVLAGRPDAADRLARARLVVDAGDPLSSALLDRVDALAAGDRPGLLGAAAALRAAGSRYQWARSLVLAGGAEAGPGREAFAAMGATPSAPAAAFG